MYLIVSASPSVARLPSAGYDPDVSKSSWLRRYRHSRAVAIAAPVIDDRNYETLLGEILRRIPVYSPEWTDFNASDPGVTLVELFAFLTDTLLWQIDERHRQRRRRRRVAFLVVGTAGIGLFLWTCGRKRNASYDLDV
jgi:hypothetical protein